MNHDVEELLSLLETSHEQLLSLMRRDDAPAPKASAFPAEWAVSDVISHLGSGAEIFALILRRLVQDEPAPVQEDFVSIWSRWDAKAPEDQVQDGLQSDAYFVDVAVSASSEITDVPAFGSIMPISEFLAMRLQEHIVHTWDIETAVNPSATFRSDYLPFLLDQLPSVAPRSARPVTLPLTVDIRVLDPDAWFRLDLGAEASLAPLDSAPQADLTMSAEPFVRMIFGRLLGARAVVSGAEAELATHLTSVFQGY